MGHTVHSVSLCGALYISSQILSNNSASLDVILCHFQDDICNWKITSETDYYKWKRYNGKSLSDEEIPGPNGDLNSDQQKYFLLASTVIGENDKPGHYTILSTEEFVVKEHPVECLSFWYEFGVSTVVPLNSRNF